MKNTLLCTKIISIIGFTAVVLCGCSLDNKSNIEVATETINEADTETTTHESTTEVNITDEETEESTTNAEKEKSFSDYMDEIRQLGIFTDEELEQIEMDAALIYNNVPGRVSMEDAFNNALNLAKQKKGIE